MKIGIDCRTILNPDAGEKAGVAHYTFHLVKNLLAADRLDEFVLFFDHRARDIYKDFLEPNTIIRFFSFSRYKKYLPFIYSHVLSASTLSAEKLNIYHSPANVVPLNYRSPFVVTIHDLAIYREPNFFPSRQGFSIKYLVPKTVQRARLVIVPSQSTARDVQEFFDVPAERVRITRLGVDQARFQQTFAELETRAYLKERYKIKRKYILFVGTLEPRKNLIRLMEAFYQLTQRNRSIRSEYQLVLAGAKGWLYQEVFDEVESRGLSDMVVFPGYLPYHDLPKLYSQAELFVYPSLYEGFGLPVLESMAAGVPVITSTTSSLAEIAEGAAVLVDPLDVEGLSMQIERLLYDETARAGLSQRGKSKASEFSWKACAEKTLQVYQEAAG